MLPNFRFQLEKMKFHDTIEVETTAGIVQVENLNVVAAAAGIPLVPAQVGDFTARFTARCFAGHPPSFTDIVSACVSSSNVRVALAAGAQHFYAHTAAAVGRRNGSTSRGAC